MTKVVCFDFDNVIVDTSLAIKLLVFGDKFKEFSAGIDFLLHNTEPKKFFKSVKKIMRLAKGMPEDRIKKILLEAHITEGAKETFQSLKKKKVKIVIASINDADLIKECLKKNNLLKYVDHIYASKMGVRDGKLTGEISGDVIETEKVGVVNKIEKLYRVKRKDILYIGDGLTDLPIMKSVGRGILFSPNSLTKTEVFSSKEFDKRGK